MKLTKYLAIASIIFSSQLVAKDIYTVGFAQDTMGNDWRIAQVREVENGFKNKDNIRFFYTNGKSNTTMQIMNIEDMIATDVDLIISSPRDAKVMTPVIQKAYEKGIPVILLSRTISNDKYTSFIHPKNTLIAKQAAKFIAKKLNYKGNVFVLQHTPTSTPGIRRTQGFLEEIKKFPNIKIVDMKVANSLRSEAILKTEEAIKEGLKFDAIYAQSDSMAIGAIMALKANKIDPKKIVITGIDYISEARELIKKGELDATYIYPTGGNQGVQIAMKILEGKKVQKEIIIESAQITIDNVDQIKPIF
jgi:ribose transport system substrate-binding protein